MRPEGALLFQTSPVEVALGSASGREMPHSFDTVAAVDLGSNSFHMVVGRFVDGQLRILDRLREPVALARGLEGKLLTDEAQQRALDCLQRFGQRLEDMRRGSVRAVGTNTLRQARNSGAFLTRAEGALGHPIEVISGREEARMIYLGVAQSLEQNVGRRLVVDIGGGSTECIIGEQLDAVQTDSLYMGCVSYSQRFFPDGEITQRRMRKAEVAAGVELEPIRHRYTTLGWDSCVGSSGTVRAIAAILRENGWSKNGITRKGLDKLRKNLLSARHVDRISLAGLKDGRSQVLAAGLAILIAAFESFGIARMIAANGALREGLLHDLVGRLGSGDVRHQTIRDVVRRYHVDLVHAARVERTALFLLDQTAEAWSLDAELGRQFLTWAARLHEVGLDIAYAGHHKHGAYIVRNSDLPGFSRQDQELLAAIIGSHRRKIAKNAFAQVRPGRRDVALRLTVLLRLAVHLNRGRSERQLPRFAVRPDGTEGLTLTLPAGWLEEHPLTGADLEEEAAALAAAGFKLSVS